LQTATGGAGAERIALNVGHLLKKILERRALELLSSTENRREVIVKQDSYMYLASRT